MPDSTLELTLRRIQASLHDLVNEVHEVKLSVDELARRSTSLEDRVSTRFSDLEERVLRLERLLGVVV